jgi:hypothetical protein
LGCTTNKRSIPFGYLNSSAGSGSSGSNSGFSGVFIAEEVDGLGDRASGNTTMVDVPTLMYNNSANKLHSSVLKIVIYTMTSYIFSDNNVAILREAKHKG